MHSLKKRSQQGFTIVELLIVIVVIGILAALVITTYNGIQQKARNTERTTDLKALQSHIEAYYAENGKYPTNSDLGTDSAGNVTFIKASMKGLDQEALRDPKGTAGDFSLATTPTANKYAYQPTKDDNSTCDGTAGNECTKYTLTATLEGGGTTVLNSLN